LTVLIPERDNPGELAQCLTSVRRAANEWREPLDTMVVVNGSTETAYRRLRAEYPEVRWQFHDRALGFTGAVDAGLRQTHRDWVYLLNDDVVLDPAALRAVGEHRGDGVFSVASQIVLKDETRFREETNWTTLLVEDGLATVHDWIPKSEQPAATFYAGGGASLFRTRLLRNVLSRSVYHPFYWEDVEWGWRARKLGYESVFCPESIAHHTQHATIGRLYAAEDVERIVTRNRLLFQLRNFTETGSVERAMEAIARTDDVEYFLTARVKWQIGRGRFWNHRAPVTDEEVFGRWTGPGRQEIQSRS
jgi:GT2 family glycosyltransferase